ncbi:non-hydrolyzing UDP-N-acetylglucosamine 2-epimerase [Megasphaera vaginalis (ex Srinivasan et al. 2021)]|uniref:UDP-N-acetylglucosamine 2-epimerase (non-hydrolyzing) n=1 Tax=Megasphaera vaginalis (ex Srinivasan et al. 2021) TaxID=1111454 RepID=U7URG4_9FIRM|nr:UDP-N-acetylglucosamine 2-epimerase (non-hydrolyzing) [Megasphaera vaginalis (ex Srinivasan et al. 2021)]ERT61876.1 UDP-N-acetylglucosamine 2-epimerase [Megasphaera vaginalis (ex Srinivasan et al. 2021)]
MLKVMTIFGTRPEAIKMAPVVLELKKHAAEIETVVTVTAQHRQMLDQVLKLFRIRPDYDLDIMSQGQTLYDITTRALQGLKTVLEKEKPDLVLVHGDTTTTFAGALAAYYQQIPVGHVEAGLRTGNIYSPFPEEMNRKLTGAMTAVHFSPTPTAKANLLCEGIAENSVYVTGNTVIDALMNTVRDDYRFADDELQGIDFGRRRMILLTTHRRENLGEPMRHIYKALRSIIDEIPDTEIVFPVHRNPLVRRVVEEELSGAARIHLIEPLEYEPFANLMNRSCLVLTDSGGIQEEAPSLGKPVLVLRDTTERPEAIAAGTVRLIGTRKDVVYGETKKLLTDDAAYEQMSNAVNPYGDGLAAKRIVQAILYVFCKFKEKPEEFL